ncbi:MAG: bifunctional nuclease domain-containing protein [Dehalococcoidia bacterium]
MLQMNVTIVAGCECEQHAWVHLRDGTGGRRARVMIDAAVGRAIVSELRGSPSPHAEAVDLLGTSLAALGASAERIELRCADGALSGVLCLRNANGPASAVVDPCHALLTACRMKLPIVMEEADILTASQAAPPAAFHQFLNSLDLSGLDPAAEGRQP